MKRKFIQMQTRRQTECNKAKLNATRPNKQVTQQACKALQSNQTGCKHYKATKQCSKQAKLRQVQCSKTSTTQQAIKEYNMVN